MYVEFVHDLVFFNVELLLLLVMVLLVLAVLLVLFVALLIVVDRPSIEQVVNMIRFLGGRLLLLDDDDI